MKRVVDVYFLISRVDSINDGSILSLLVHMLPHNRHKKTCGIYRSRTMTCAALVWLVHESCHMNLVAKWGNLYIYWSHVWFCELWFRLLVETWREGCIWFLPIASLIWFFQKHVTWPAQVEHGTVVIQPCASTRLLVHLI